MRMIVQFQRLADVRYISQLDMLRTIHRGLRRADIPVAYSEGFNPQPRVSFGFALSVGLVSLGEYMDIHLKCDISPEEFISRMNAAMPKAMQMVSAAAAGDGTPKIGKMIDCAEFETVFECENAELLQENLNGFFNQEQIVIERHTKRGVSNVDIKKYIYYHNFEKQDDTHIRLVTVQALSEEMSVRIDDVVSAIIEYSQMEIKYGVTKLNTLLRQGDGFITPVEFIRTTKSEQK